MKYVWLNIHTGEFSNSWDRELHEKTVLKDPIYLEAAKRDGYKLIEYTCSNDDSFEFYNKMKIVTQLKP